MHNARVKDGITTAKLEIKVLSISMMVPQTSVTEAHDERKVALVDDEDGPLMVWSKKNSDCLCLIVCVCAVCLCLVVIWFYVGSLVGRYVWSILIGCM